MADQKISALTALTEAAAADELPIVDDSASETKKITFEDLVGGASKAELGHLSGVTSSIQTQIDSKEPTKGSDDNYVTDAEKVVIGNTSGTNTGDMSNADVKTAYEANADTNAYTDSEKTVVGNTSGTNTGDQSLTAYQLKPSEGAFVDGDKTKLDGIETAADVTDATNVAAAGAVMDTGNETVAGVKTFSSSPVVPTPTTDMQSSTKKYVDDNAGGAPEGTAVKSTGETGGVKFLGEEGDGTSSWKIPGGGGDMLKSTYDPASISEQLVGLTATQTITNKTINGDNNTITHVSANDVDLNTVNGLERTLSDYMNTIQSAGYVSGGDFSDNGDGTATISAGAGFIKTTNVLGADSLGVAWSEEASLALTANATNYIYVDYNSGTPTIGASTTNPPDYRTYIHLGKIYKNGTNVLHLFKAGAYIPEHTVSNLQRWVAQFGEVALTGGGVVAETGERYLTVSSATLFGGIVKTITDAVDTSGADTFQQYYADGVGGWNESSESQINNTQYNNGGTLTNLGNNRHRTDFVYLDNDGHVAVILGTNNDYFISDAQEVKPPSSVPGPVAHFATLIAKVIVKEGETNLEEINNIETGTTFSPSGNVVHNETTGIQGGTADEYYHLTDAQMTIATQAADTTNSGYLLTNDWDTFNEKLGNVVEDTNPQLGGDLDVNGNKITSASNGVVEITPNGTGAIGVGTSAPQDMVSSAKFLMSSDDDNYSDFGNVLHSTSGYPAYFLARARGTEASPAIVQDGDDLGSLVFLGYDGTGYSTSGSYIQSTVDGTPATGSISAEMMLYSDKIRLAGSTFLEGEMDAKDNSIGFTLQTATGDGTTTINWGSGNKFKFTFGAQNDTFTFTAPAKPGAFQLILVQDGTGSRTAAWPATVKWAGGTAPTLSTAASSVDIVSFLYDGTNYYATSSLNFS